MSFALSRFGVVRISHMPTFVSVEPAAICQLRCPECPVSGKHIEPALLSPSLFERILAEAAPTAHTIQFYFQGEPLLNKRLTEMIHQASREGLYTIVSTNAQALTQETATALVESGLNRIIVSIDGFSEASYSAYRVGGSLAKAFAGLRYLADAKRDAKRRGQKPKLKIVLQVLRLRTNEHEWQWIERNYRSLGADRLEFKTAQLHDYEHGHPLMPSDERYSRYRKGKGNIYYLKRANRHPSLCHRLWTGCVITTRGEVLPCCYDKDSAHSYGNIETQSLQALYHSEKAQAFRRSVLTGRDVDICKNCVQ